MMGSRPGAASVAELVLVSWLFGIILVAAAGVVHRQGRLAAAQRDLVRLQEARRTARVVLGSEVRWAGIQDLRLAPPESLVVRALRGGGVVCERGDGWLVLRYEGVRAPDPDKDSVLVLRSEGEEVVRLLDVSESNACGGGALRLAVALTSEAGAAYALVFEAGSYHASDGALRYRLGQAGRQPLTEAIFGHIGLRASSGSGGVLLSLRAHPDSLTVSTGESELFAGILHSRTDALP